MLLAVLTDCKFMVAMKSIVNKTAFPITVTFYICGRVASELDNFGTRRFSLAPGQLADIAYGDVRHSFLAGIKLESDIHGMHVEQKQMVVDTDNDFDHYLNSSRVLTIRDINLPLMEAV